MTPLTLPHLTPPPASTTRRLAITFAMQRRMQSFRVAVSAQLPLPWLPPPMVVFTPEGPHRRIIPPPQTLSLALLPSGALVPSRPITMMSISMGANPHTTLIPPPLSTLLALNPRPLGPQRLMMPLNATSPLGYSPPTHTTSLALTLLPSGPRLRTPVGGHPCFAIQSAMTALLALPRTSDHGPHFHPLPARCALPADMPMHVAACVR